MSRIEIKLITIDYEYIKMNKLDNLNIYNSLNIVCKTNSLNFSKFDNTKMLQLFDTSF